MLTMSQINTKIAGIKKSATSLRDNVHIVLVNCAAHAYVHGDVTAYEKLFEATSGMNRKRMAKWIRDFGFANIQEDGSFKLNKRMRNQTDFADGDAVIDYLEENARAWYADEESASDIARELDVAARLKSLKSQVKNAASKNTVVKVDFPEIKTAMAELAEVLAEVDKAEANPQPALAIAAE